MLQICIYTALIKMRIWTVNCCIILHFMLVHEHSVLATFIVSRRACLSVGFSYCLSVCLTAVFQNASSLAILVRIQWYISDMGMTNYHIGRTDPHRPRFWPHQPSKEGQGYENIVHCKNIGRTILALLPSQFTTKQGKTSFSHRSWHVNR